MGSTLGLGLGVHKLPELGLETLSRIFGDGNFYAWSGQDSNINPRQAADFNGTTQYLNSASTDFDMGDESFSFGGWMLCKDVSASQQTFGRQDGGILDDRAYLINFNVGTTSWNAFISSDGTAANQTQVTGDTTTVVDTWYFVVAVYDHTNDVWKISINGGKFVVASHVGGSYSGSVADLVIGANNINGTPSYGAVSTDELFFSTRAMPLEDIITMYNGGSGVSHSTFTDGSLNGTEQPIGKWFNETDTAYNIDSVLTPLASTTTGSFSFWYKPDNVSPAANERFIAFGDTDANTFINFYMTTAGLIGGACGVAGTLQWNFRTDAVPFVVGTWYFVTVTQNGTAPQLFIDGTEPAHTHLTTTDETVWFNDIPGLDNGRIGALDYNNLGNDGWLNGTIDGVMFHDDALSLAEHTAFYNSGNGISYDDMSAAQKTNLVAMWEMNGLCNANETDRVSSLAATPIGIPASSPGIVNDSTVSTIESNLVSWYEFDSDSSVTTDAQGTNTLTNNNSVTVVDGKVTGDIDNNDPIFRVNDFGSNDKDAEQTTLANRPVYLSSGLNSKAAIDFDDAGGENMTVGTVSDFNFMHDGTVSWCALVVLDINASTGINQFLFSNMFSSAERGITLFYQDATNTMVLRTSNGTTSTDLVSTNTASFGTDSFVICGYNKTTDELELYFNDDTLDSVALGLTPSGSDAARVMTFCGRPGAPTTVNFDGQVGEISFGSGVAPSDAYTQLRKYITQKWGI